MKFNECSIAKPIIESQAAFAGNTGYSNVDNFEAESRSRLPPRSLPQRANAPLEEALGAPCTSEWQLIWRRKLQRPNE